MLPAHCNIVPHQQQLSSGPRLPPQALSPCCAVPMCATHEGIAPQFVWVRPKPCWSKSSATGSAMARGRLHTTRGRTTPSMKEPQSTVAEQQQCGGHNGGTVWNAQREWHSGTQESSSCQGRQHDSHWSESRGGAGPHPCLCGYSDGKQYGPVTRLQGLSLLECSMHFRLYMRTAAATAVLQEVLAEHDCIDQDQQCCWVNTSPVCSSLRPAAHLGTNICHKQSDNTTQEVHTKRHSTAIR